jgi:hypothetical protein
VRATYPKGDKHDRAQDQTASRTFAELGREEHTQRRKEIQTTMRGWLGSTTSTGCSTGLARLIGTGRKARGSATGGRVCRIGDRCDHLIASLRRRRAVLLIQLGPDLRLFHKHAQEHGDGSRHQAREEN